MANGFRSIDDIKGLMIESKERIIELWNELQNSVLTDPLLSGLNSTSQTALWRLWAFILSVNIWVHEKLWTYFKQEVEELAAKSIAGTALWYRDMCLKFQYGHALLFLNYTPQYAVDDPASRIVKQVAIIEASYGVVVIKAAKGNIGALSPLSPPELLAFTAFVNQIKFAGTVTDIVSLPADLMAVNVTVHFNPIYNLSDLKQKVEQAVVNHLQTLQFNGLFYRNKFIDAIQAVEGVVDVDVLGLFAWQGSGSVTTINRTYQSVAGYIAIDAASNPLSSTITYSPLP